MGSALNSMAARRVDYQVGGQGRGVAKVGFDKYDLLRNI